MKYSRHVLVYFLFLLGIAAIFYRLFSGLGAVSALSDAQPWGLTKSVNILTGASLATGGSVIAALVYVFGLKRLRPLARPALLLGFILHTFVLLAILYDVGSPIDVWRIMLKPNLKSAMFLAFFCEVLYTSSVIAEVVPEFLAEGRFQALAMLLRPMKGPVILLTAFALVIYQNTLGTLYLVSPHRVDPLWYTPWLPVLFFLSAVAAGLGMVVVEAYLSDRAGRRPFDIELMRRVGSIIAVFLWMYLLLRLGDVAARRVFTSQWVVGPHTVWFVVEVLAGSLAPALMFSIRSIRSRPAGLFYASALTAAGVLMNRIGVAVVGWANPHGYTYFPSLIELYVSAFFLLAPVAIYAKLDRPLSSLQV